MRTPQSPLQPQGPAPQRPFALVVAILVVVLCRAARRDGLSACAGLKAAWGRKNRYGLA